MTPTPTRLPSADREFFSAIDQVAYSNPFTDERTAIVRSFVEMATPEELATNRDREAALAKLVVAPRLEPWMDAQKRSKLGGDDASLLRSAFFYTSYHRHVAAIDALIQQQLSSGDPPVSEGVAASVVGDFARWGLDEELAVRMFGFFFQLRRAFYFVVVSLPGRSESMRGLRRALWDNVFTRDMRVYQERLWNHMEDFSTLLLGETGTGKGQAAAAIGRSQFIPYLPKKRRFATNFTDSFTAINLAQFPETLIESELFGHRKGAFTGAIEEHQGVLELCSEQGALFLDEIGEAGVPIQIKLLRVLQDRVFTPIGSHEIRRFKGRVIAASNRPVEELRRKGGFRDDFYYRLCSDVIVVPSLRQRIRESPDELDLLVDLLVTRTTGARSESANERVLAALRRDLPPAYRWPGNVRELEQAVRRIILTGRYVADAPNAATDVDEDFVQRVSAGTMQAEEMLERYCALLYRRYGTYEEVARRAALDRRTAKKYVEAARGEVTPLPAP